MIATKNSAGWFGEILHAYRKLAIRPLVLLDNASEDGTQELLEREHVEYARVVPEFPRVEAIVRLIPKYTDIPWVLRLDDDEFPSRALIDWILDRLDGLDTNILGIPRRWVRMGKSGHCEFSNHPLLKQDQDKMDIQWRLFRPDRVDYITDIHSPGFRASAALAAPDEAFLVHFGSSAPGRHGQGKWRITTGSRAGRDRVSVISIYGRTPISPHTDSNQWRRRNSTGWRARSGSLRS